MSKFLNYSFRFHDGSLKLVVGDGNQRLLKEKVGMDLSDFWKASLFAWGFKSESLIWSARPFLLDFSSLKTEC